MRGWMKILGAVALVVAVLLAAGLALRFFGPPGEDATELVRRAARALEEVSVSGTMTTVIRTPDGPRTTRAQMHRGDGRFVMRFLGGPTEGTVVHRQDGAVWVEGEGGRVGRRADVGEAGLRPELLERNWTFTTAGIRRVAGRRVTMVRGEGPGGTINLALDRETGFPLHISRRDRRGELISETTWVDADFSVQPPPLSEPPPPREQRSRQAVTLQEARAAVDFTVLEPGWLPKGWELEGWYLHEGRGGRAIEARATDGLRALVIIQRSAEAAAPRREAGEGEPARPRDRQQTGERRGDGDGERRWDREHRDGDRPERPDRPDRPADEGRERSRVMHLRGAGGDAIRREIDGTIVVVIGPADAAARERILDEMQPPS
ncbi:MAG: hypothetical protein ACOX9R_14695 [Armatimonadota bacterium]|jgi:hypothetical protein